YVSRDELLDQIYPMRRKFTSYKSYADAMITDVFSSEELNGVMKLQATELQTMVFMNEGGRFVAKQLPLQAQFAPVYKIITLDINKDGFQDLILLGNNDYPRLKLGKIDACFGTLLLNDGKANFTYVPQANSGLRIAGDAKDAIVLELGGEQYLVTGINNNALLTYRINRR
ncbi:MAG TPA: RNA-binding protein, partial [Chitinophagaceae bacterium]